MVAKVFSFNPLREAMRRVDSRVTTHQTTAQTPDDDDGLSEDERRLRKMTIDAISKEIRSGQSALVDLEAEAHRVINGIRACQDEIVRRLPDIGIKGEIPKDGGNV